MLLRRWGGHSSGLQCSEPFSSAHVDFDTLLLSRLSCSMNLRAPHLKALILEHTQNAVIERHGLAATVLIYELADFAIEEVDGRLTSNC